MFICLNFKKYRLEFTLFIVLVFSIIFTFITHKPTISTMLMEEGFSEVIQEIFDLRNEAILQQDTKTLDALYDKSIKYGLWAYEHEIKKMKYLHKWSEKQGVKFTDINTITKIRNIKKKEENKYSINLMVSTEYKYSYEGEERSNAFRIGTYHYLDIVNRDNEWIIVKEWYVDPFADSMHLDDIKSEEIKQYILSQQERDFSNLNERRKGAVEYADKYSGAASEEKYGFKYNPKYRNYNPLGGDCANFASQILHEGGKFRKTSVWNYDSGGASKAWVNAHAFKNYMINSGRASVIAYGTYDKVYKASYKLLPGDFVAYEKNGKITHISVATGADSKGYSLVNCHNTDRHRVPWDLGWSNKNIKFWLVRVHY
ncbi:Putative amidase domain-containing protein [Alkalithermobacter thermoalcaliphilus JW-YL-7 = DSM 7308]|uniref:Amidase domain-containing protein n=1 Tax=Alkalithermobacter thermoalcaliphilus JW-YL-7 = DSM 7308 TaxID=1121328 RepID=A0A150FQ14_CLOPD|nr:putative amidase domain containing protein [[Clostridium] paradoxum JW-YL-7 = DSM 7308]SHK64063.1 Putative amidase domain-containing protein [[Clostridium] paradoxum JW-YL-7 = DSM 7308]